MIWSRIIYRVQQFSNTFATINDYERGVVEKYLNPAQQRLFYGMGRLGQRHCLDVYQSLVRNGYRNEELLQAALLHDVGKIGVGLWDRVLTVLLEALSPALLERLAQPKAWRYGLFKNLHHAERGATLIEQTGASSLTVHLVRCHQAKDVGDPRLLAFKRADEAN